MIRLVDALAGVQRLGLDASPFIYLIERNPAYLATSREAFRQINAGVLSGHSSVITLTEVLVQPLQRGNAQLAGRYRRFLTRSRNLTLEPLSAIIAESAANLRARYGLRTPDALHLATVISAGCTAFLTNDRRLQRVTEVNVLVLADLSL